MVRRARGSRASGGTRVVGAGLVAAVGMAAVVVAGACGGGAGEGGSETVGARGAPPENHDTTSRALSRNPSIAPDTSCPPTGLWAECSLVKRLEMSGLGLERAQDPATEEPLTRQGVAFRTRSAELEAYFFPDRSTREREQRRLDRDRYITPEQSAAATDLPTLVASENLLVILHSRRERQRERIALAITAGPPQPPSR